MPRARAKKKQQVLPNIFTSREEILKRPERETFYVPQLGPQSELWGGRWWFCYEILLGGAKAGGKSAAGRAWLGGGNPEKQLPGVKLTHDCDISYFYHPHYRALVLRRNRDDLNDWVNRAAVMYGKFNAEWKAADSEFVFPSGARIIVDHLADDKAFYSYEGNEIHRLLIEELTLIPSYRLYANVKKNVRTEYPELRPQILCTTNPPGPGMSWVKERFVNPWPAGNKGMYETKTDPFTGEKTKVYRVYVPMRVEHNKILLKSDPTYVARMMSDLQTEEEQRAYIHGDWNAMEGVYFKNFRPDGPRKDEPKEARHVYKPGELPIMKWWPRVMSMDVGFQDHAVVYKAAIRPEGRLHIYGELAEAQVDNEQWGVRIAQWVWKELQQLTRPLIVLWMSHDAFGQKGDPKTRAEQINEGIRKVLGPDSSIIMNGGEDGTKFLEGLQLQRDAKIVLRRAPRQRVDGWQYMHGLMRFRPLAKPNLSLYNHEYAQQLLEDGGMDDYMQYKRAFEERAVEVLPRIVMENAPLAKKYIPQAVRQTAGEPTGTTTKANPEDIINTKDLAEDVRDAVRYLCMGFKHQTEIEPPDVYVDERVQEALKQNPYLDDKALFEIRVKGYEMYEDKLSRPVAFNIGRGSPRREGVRVVQ